jgi:hypothetical protein
MGCRLKKQAQYYIDRRRTDTANSLVETLAKHDVQRAVMSLMAECEDSLKAG